MCVGAYLRLFARGCACSLLTHACTGAIPADARRREEVRRRQRRIQHVADDGEPSAAVGTERNDGNRHVLQRAVLAAILGERQNDESGKGESEADDSEMHGPTCCTCCRCGLGVEGEMVIDEGNHGPDICTCCPHLDDVLSQQNKSWQRDRDMKSPQPDGSSPYLHDTPETSEDEGDESGKGMSEA